MAKLCLDCGVITANTRCPTCVKANERRRGTRTQRGYDQAWSVLSRSVLATARQAGMGCAHCGTAGERSNPLTVDHIIPLAHGGARLDRANLQVLCRRCNSAKGGRTRR